MLEPPIVGQVVERLSSSPELAADLMLFAIERQGAADFVERGATGSLESWWAGLDPAARRDLLVLLLDHVTVLPPAGPDDVLDVAGRLSFAWRQ